MYRSFYKLREKPFSLLPDPAFLYVSSKHRKALAKLRSGILNRAGMTVITGEIGSGKTTLIQHLVRELESEVTIGLINNVHSRFDDLLGWVLQAFDIEVPDSSEAKLHGAFVNFVKDQATQGGRALLFIDETQNMPAAVLEELRLLMNINIDYPAFEVVLVGQPELRGILEQPDMRQFAQRVAVEHHLQPLDEEETGEYIQHRLVVAGGDAALFDTEACDMIYQRSHGVPRLINSLCDTVLEYGFDQQRESIDGALVRDILNDRVNGQLLALAEPHYISKVQPTIQAESATNVTNVVGDRRFAERAQSSRPAGRQAPERRPGNLDEALKALADVLD
jgi:type II secretory pathway predicted ATPase ExeA